MVTLLKPKMHYKFTIDRPQFLRKTSLYGMRVLILSYLALFYVQLSIGDPIPCVDGAVGFCPDNLGLISC